MNLVHLKYAVEVAETGSINKASEKLYVSQPNLSRAIKELEASLGVTIFDRSAKGMVLTPDGEVFVRYARSILRQVDAIEEVFSKGTTEKKKFSISVPRASYVTDAFAEFSKLLDKDTPVEIFYKETNSMRSMKNILQDEYKLCIIRYAEGYDKYYKSTFDEKGLTYELITEFQYVLLMSKNSMLVEKEDITFDDLRDRIEIAHADPYVPSLPLSETKKKSCRTIRKGAYSCSRERVSLNCSRATPTLSCGSPPFRRSCSTDTGLSSASARRTHANIKTCWFTARIMS